MCLNGGKCVPGELFASWLTGFEPAIDGAASACSLPRYRLPLCESSHAVLCGADLTRTGPALYASLPLSAQISLVSYSRASPILKSPNWSPLPDLNTILVPGPFSAILRPIPCVPVLSLQLLRTGSLSHSLLLLLAPCFPVPSPLLLLVPCLLVPSCHVPCPPVLSPIDQLYKALLPAAPIKTDQPQKIAPGTVPASRLIHTVCVKRFPRW